MQTCCCVDQSPLLGLAKVGVLYTEYGLFKHVIVLTNETHN